MSRPDNLFFMPPEQYLAALDEPSSAVNRHLLQVYGGDESQAAAARPIYRLAITGFRRAFPEADKVAIMRSTGRVNLLGMHIDHRGGSINTIAVHELLLAVSLRDDDLVVLENEESQEYPPRRFSISREHPGEWISDWEAWTRSEFAARKRAGKSGDWADYFKAAALYLQNLAEKTGGGAIRGFNGFVVSTIPRASGLSSSSALVVAAMEVLTYHNNLSFSDSDFIDHCGAAEWYVGTRGGKGDHASIRFGRPGALNHISFFPLRVERLELPGDCRAVLCHSLVEAFKSRDARDVFNNRVASYQVGLRIIQRNHPELADRLEMLRDLTPRRLGLGDGEIYRLLLELPQAAGRTEIRELLPGEDSFLDRIFDTHREPQEGYRVREVCLYGAAACDRSEVAAELLRNGDIRAFGELMFVSHDGDRVTRPDEGGNRRPFSIDYSDERLEKLAREAEAGRESARLYRQPGGYRVSCPELDELVDIASGVEGVLGASLVGAGLGGCVVVLVESRGVEGLLAVMAERFYRPRGAEPAVNVCYPVRGSGFLQVRDS